MRCSHLTTAFASALLMTFALTDLVQASELGRLFYTPEQRDALNALRHTATAPREGSSQLTVEGLITPSHGAATIMTRRSDGANAPLPPISLQSRNSVTILTQPSRPSTSRVGDGIDLVTGKKTPLISEGAVLPKTTSHR